MVKINDIEFLLGCDPEVFVKNQGKYVCAHGLVRGTKKKPEQIKGGMVQIDGMALEFGIDPVKTENGFVRRTTNVLNRVREGLPAGFTIDPTTPTVTFDREIMDAAPEESKELGCDPDYNAYTGELNPRPDGEVPFRTTAGHIHVGWTKNMDPREPTHFMACRMLAIAMDKWVGLPSLAWDSTPAAMQRRQLYGKAGAFRPKPYGMEYRTLSSKWLQHPDLMRFVYRQTVRAIQDLFAGNYDPESNYRNIIDSTSLQSAFYFCESLGIQIPKPPAGMSRAKRKEAA